MATSVLAGELEDGRWGNIIVKKSSPKNLSVDCRSTVGRHITDSLPTGYRQLTDRLPTVSQRRKLLRKHTLNMT